MHVHTIGPMTIFTDNIVYEGSDFSTLDDIKNNTWRDNMTWYYVIVKDF